MKNKWEIKPYTEILKDDIDLMAKIKDIDSKVGMAEEIIYSLIKMSAKDNPQLQAEIVSRTMTALVNNHERL